MNVITVVFIVYVTCCIINLLHYRCMFIEVDKRPNPALRLLGFIATSLLVVSGPIVLVSNTVNVLRLRWFWWRNHKKITQMILDEIKRQGIELVD